MANKSIIDVDALNSLADSDSLFVNSDGSLKQVAVEDAGLTRIGLLWENASSRSEFTAQTINLDLSEYDAVIILTLWQNSHSGGYNSQYIPVNTAGCLYVPYYLNVARGISVLTTGITFDEGVLVNTYGVLTSGRNDMAIPYKIYGIKGTCSNLPSLITFSLDGSTYRALEGMTWAEWVNSGYNTYSSGTIGALGSVVAMGQYTLVLSNSIVSPTDIIINNGEYVWSGGGSND